MKPKVSIVVPVYNVEKYIKRCVDSLINQTLKEIEIILVDDGSKDNCPAICDDYAKQDSRIKVIHKENEGLGFARNSGLNIAAGQFVAFLDSDDFVKEDMYEKLIAYAEVNNLDTCFCRSLKYYASGETISLAEANENKVFRGRDQVDEFLMTMLGGEQIAKKKNTYSLSACKAIYSMDLIKSSDILFLSERMMASEDLFFHIDYLSQAGGVGWLNEPLHYYFYNNMSISNTYSKEEYNRIKTSMKELAPYLNKYYSYSFYKMFYYGQLLRFQHIIFRFEILKSNIPYKSIREIIRKECSEPLISGFSDSINIRLPLKRRILYFAIKNKLVDLVYLLIRGNESLKMAASN